MKKKMRPSNKKLVKRSWFERLLSFEIFSIPIKTWGLLFIFFGAIFGYYIFTVSRAANFPATSETFTGEVSRIWMEQHEGDTGGSRIYRVDLTREENEVTCTIPSVNIGIWQNLEIGMRYEFSISQTVRGCYVNKAVKLEGPESFEWDN